jgi:hypothetical protein
MEANMATGKKKAAKQSKTKKRAAKPPSKATHHAVFKSLIAMSNHHDASPVCYQQLGNGSWVVCFLQSDGSYGQCQEYTGSTPHGPICG